MGSGVGVSHGRRGIFPSLPLWGCCQLLCSTAGCIHLLLCLPLSLSLWGSHQVKESCHFAPPQSVSVSVFVCLRLRLRLPTSLSISVFVCLCGSVTVVCTLTVCAGFLCGTSKGLCGVVKFYLVSCYCSDETYINLVVLEEKVTIWIREWKRRMNVWTKYIVCIALQAFVYIDRK